MIGFRSLYLVPSEPRPRTRGECVAAPRPCPYVSCRHHLLITSITPEGELRGPQRVEVEDMVESCSLDVADREEPANLGEIGALMGLSHERIRQIEELGFERLKKRGVRALLDGWSHASAGGVEETLAEIIDADFKAGVERAYQRIVPASEQGAQAMRVARGRP